MANRVLLPAVVIGVVVFNLVLLFMVAVQLPVWSATSAATAASPPAAVASAPKGLIPRSGGLARRLDAFTPEGWYQEPPPDRQLLGHSTWTMLHKMVGKYPAEPTQEERRDMATFFRLLGEFYPCDECAGHFRGMLEATPVDGATRSNTDLHAWLCARHNQVNVRLGKPEFPCDPEVLEDRWGGCGCAEATEDAEAAPGPNLRAAAQPK